MPRVEPDNSELRSQIESLLLAAGGPVSVSLLAQVTGTSRIRVAAALGELQRTLSGGIRVQLHADDAQLASAPENAETVHRYLGTAKPSPLSRATLETLAVVAYRQPVTRAEIEATRGANSDRSVHMLLARELIEECGVRPTLGRPMQYGTTFGFLEYFGLQSLDELPALPEEFPLPVQQLGMRPLDKNGITNDRSAGE